MKEMNKQIEKLAEWTKDYKESIRADYGVLEIEDKFEAIEAALRLIGPLVAVVESTRLDMNHALAEYRRNWPESKDE